MNTKRLFILLFVSLLFTPIYADKVSVGDDHTMFITTDGTLWACGFYRFRGVLGDGTLIDRYTPVKIKEHVLHVSAGRYHSLFITEDGTLWGCGNAGNGELGVEIGDHTATPVKIMTGVKTATAGGGCSYIIKNDGSLWACGDNDRGQLGDGTLEDRKAPVKIMDDVTKVSAGQSHVLILKTDGSVWSCGKNNAGCLGDGSKDDSSSPLKIMDDVKQISAGLWHSLMIKTDGSLWGCGGAYCGELGKGEDYRTTVPVKLMEDVVFASAGQWCSMVVKKDGSLWACGYNETGMLGIGSTDNVYEFQKVMDDVARVYSGSNSFHIAVVKKDGTLLTCGSNSFGQLGNGTDGGQTTPLNVMSGVKETSARLYHSLILRTDNSLWACGNNNYGQLGDGTTVPKSNPVRISGGVAQVSAGYFHTMFIKNDGTLWGCGLNASGQLGDGTTEDRLTPVKIMDDVKQVSAGGHHTMILKTDGSLWACGYNDGRLGTGNTLEEPTSIPVKIMNNVEKVFAGDYHTMIIKTDGTLWICGSTYYGSYGSQSTPEKIMDDVIWASGGRRHSLFIKTDGSLWAWGQNMDGAIGDGTKEERREPVWIMDGVIQVSAGGYHSLILKKNGELWSCGRNSNGECGHDSSRDDCPVPVKVMDNVIHISAAGSAGDEHSLIVTSDNQLYACGSRTYGQLGDGRSEVYPGKIMDNVVFSEIDNNDIAYLIDDEIRQGCLREIKTTEQHIAIPSEIMYCGKTYGITVVGDSIFQGRSYETSLLSATFPQTIETVSDKAFDVYGAHSVVWKSNTKLPSHTFDNPLYGKGNFLLYVNSAGIAPSTIDNVVVDGKAESIRLKDGYVFHCPKEFSVGSVSYTHNYSMETGINECAGWESIALPFDVQTISHKTKGELVPFANYTKNSGKKGFWLYSLSRNGFTEASAIKANTPYILSMPHNNYYGMDFNLSGDVTFSAINTIVRNTDETNYQYGTYEGAMFYPNYRLLETSNNNFTLNVSNELTTYYGTEKPGSVFISDYRKTNPFECYFYKSASGARLLSIPFKEDATGIPTIPLFDDRGYNPIYNLNGQFVTTDQYAEPVKRLPKGIYIVNGRKVVVK